MANDQTSDQEPLRIRKYPNRRYYDTTRSQHVTLEEIHVLIRDGQDVHIVDSKTGENITAKVLAQIILELDSPKLDVFPVPLLHRLIRANEGLVQEFVEKYFNQALSAFLESQKKFEAHLREAMGLGSGVSNPMAWTQMMMPPWALAPWLAPRAAAGEAGGASEPNASAAEELRKVIADLRQQVEALQKQIAQRD
jgi:polyhydroxyalkanoate synthesis repressor PhaR